MGAIPGLYAFVAVLVSAACAGAIPTTHSERADNPFAVAFYYGVATDSPFTSIGGILTVPLMTVPPGGDPTEFYSALPFISMSDVNAENAVSFGVYCSAGSETVCYVLYQYEPGYAPAFLSTSFSVSPGDELICSITVVSNTTVTFNAINTVTDAELSQTFTSPSAVPPYLSAEWGVEAYDGPTYIDFGEAEWSATAATRANGMMLTPDMSNAIFEMSEGGQTVSDILTSPSGITISYIPPT